jgi:hypothetical protein
MKDDMKLELTADEALVFYEWLARLDERDAFLCEDPAEQRILWTLHGQLEKALVEPFQRNYRELVEQARGRVRAEGETESLPKHGKLG